MRLSNRCGRTGGKGRRASLGNSSRAWKQTKALWCARTHARRAHHPQRQTHRRLTRNHSPTQNHTTPTPLLTTVAARQERRSLAWNSMQVADHRRPCLPSAQTNSMFRETRATNAAFLRLQRKQPCRGKRKEKCDTRLFFLPIGHLQARLVFIGRSRENTLGHDTRAYQEFCFSRLT